MADNKRTIFTGRRKDAVARVILVPGEKGVTVNKRDGLEYFNFNERLMISVRKPLVVTENVDGYKVVATAKGGGLKGQAEAIQLGIARALVALNEDNRTLLKKDSLLTRDSRIVERKKPGQPGARKKFQFSKR